MPTYTTGTMFIVTPVVALVRPDYRLVLNPHEVADAFEVPLDFLMNPAHHHRHAHRIQRHAARVVLHAVHDGARALHLGRDGGHAAQPLPVPGGLAIGRSRSRNAAPLSSQP
jgi:hypothetical protein